MCIRDRYYSFDVGQEKLTLKFQQSHYAANPVVWSKQQVDDFVLRLGFLEPDDRHKHKKNVFLRSSEVSDHMV